MNHKIKKVSNAHFQLDKFLQQLDIFFRFFFVCCVFVVVEAEANV